MDINEWRRQREDLLHTLFQLQTGRLTHWDEDVGGELGRNTTAESITRVQERLATLDRQFEADSRA